MKLSDITKLLEFIFGLSYSRMSRRKELIDLVQYPDDTIQKRYINCLVFNKLTGLSAPINDVNIIFNCFDPLRALYIYKNAPPFIQIKDGVITRPSRIKFRSASYYIMITAIWIVIATSIYGIVSLFMTPIQTDNLQLQLGIIVSVLIYFIMFMFYAINKRIFISDVDKFYYDLENTNHRS